MKKRVWCTLFTIAASGMVMCTASQDFSLHNSSLFKEKSTLLAARAYAHKDERRKRASLSAELSRKSRQEKRQLRRMSYRKPVSRVSRNNWNEMKAGHKKSAGLASNWQRHRANVVAQEAAAGALADLTIQPEWGHAGTFITNNHLINVGFNYGYAVDGYDSKGVNHDVASLTFGENSIRVQDVLLASKLAKQDTDFKAPAAEAYLKNLADNQLVFNGKAESLAVNFDLARNLWNDHLSLGFRLPVVYKKNILSANLDKSVADLFDADPANFVANYGANFTVRYGADTSRFVHDIMKAKGMSELGGSTIGLGDVEVFLQSRLHSPHFDRALVGLNFTVPTAKKAGQHRLWSPELGNGGHFETAAFFGINQKYKSWLNPHAFAQASASLAANVARRVPKRIISGNIPNTATADGKIALGKRITAHGAQPLNHFDSTIRGFSDSVTSYRMRKGAQFNVRLGNVIEKFIFRRAHLDCYYNFRAKLRDSAWKLLHSDYNLDSFMRNTQQIEHTVGLAYAYQCDEASRVRVHSSYVFAGRNVAKGFDLNLSVDYSF